LGRSGGNLLNSGTHRFFLWSACGQASVTKVGIVFVILTAVALETEDLKIIDRIRASFATGDDMVNMKRSVFCGCSAGLAVSVAFVASIQQPPLFSQISASNEVRPLDRLALRHPDRRTVAIVRIVTYFPHHNGSP